MPPKIKPFGSWKSPIQAASLVQNTLRLGQLQVVSGRILWTEGRPAEKGRTALMEWLPDRGVRELITEQDVRTRAHEYGGGAFCGSQERIVFANNADQQLYELSGTQSVRQLTNHEHFRYADAILDEQRQQVFVVGEDHSDADNVENMLLRIPLQGTGQQVVIAAGHDFYSNPQLGPDGRQLLFLTWDHPDMPWDATCLWLGTLDGIGNIAELTKIAGTGEQSIFQPLWTPQGDVVFVSDQNGWWNLYRYSQGKINCLLPLKAEFGLPQWVFGMSTYAVLEDGSILASYRNQSGSHLIELNPDLGVYQELSLPFTDIDQLHAAGDQIVLIGKTTTSGTALVSINRVSQAMQVIRKASEFELKPQYISKPELIAFESQPGEPSYGWFYPPRNPDFLNPKGELPPLVVISHGGPTAYSSGVFNLTIQYWTSRGFAIVDVNYSGSTSFGRAYRQRLNGNWGVRDVADCAQAAQYLAQQKRVDPDRLIIKGGSAGGYTTLAALTFTDVFKAGASYYGIGDLELLARDTHKFESRYLDRLVGSYPQDKKLYQERSPIHFTDQLTCPVIFLQGLDDPVVPPNQAETMVAALRQKGLPVAYVPFQGEAHGFRQATTIIKAIESEFYFYCRIFSIQPADELEEIEIFNL